MESGQNRTLTIAIVIIVLLLCCCCAFLISGWYLGDYVLEFLGI